MPKGYSLEQFYRVYDDSCGAFYEVRPDSDGLDCVEVTYNGGVGDEKTDRCFTVPPEMAALIAEALVKVAQSIKRTTE